VTELTADRQALIRLLEAFRDRHERIEEHIRGLFIRASGPLWLTTETTAMIDAFFEVPGLPRFQLLPGAETTLKYPFADSSYLLRAIDYCRHINGEKQLIFVSARPLPLLRLIDRVNDHYLVRLATGARVAVSSINTGGVGGQSMFKGRLSSRPLSDEESFRIFQASDHRLLARQTGGGMTAFYQDPRKPLEDLDRITRHQYLLAYYPTNTATDSRQRVIKLSVKRAGLTALYRHGYQVRPMPTAPEDLRRSITETRIADLVDSIRNPEPLPRGPAPRRATRAMADVLSRSPEETVIRVRASFGASQIVFVKQGEKHVGEVDLAVVVDDKRGEPLAEEAERLKLEFSAAEYARTIGPRRDLLEASLNVTVKGEPAFVRVVVYEYESNWFTTHSIRLPRQ
jgi:hypothetical protein